DGTLQHARNRPRPGGFVYVSLDGTVLGRSRGQRLPLNRDGIVHEEFNPHRGEASRAGLRVPCGGDSCPRKNGAPPMESPATSPSRLHKTVAPNAAL
ncbi:MAG TPA: hypothetical protein VI431_06245, partial [Candidatus Acidoferrum sp.]